MKLSKNQVEHIANLSRIELTDDEKEKFQSQLSDILDYVEQLSEVNTEKASPLSQVTGLPNVFRPDKSESFGLEKELIEQAPKQEEGYIRVKRVLE